MAEEKEPCPCKSGKPLDECCGPVIAGTRRAATAAELMRARYSAYATGKVKFLYESAGPEARGEFDEKAATDWSRSAEWHGMEILHTDAGGENDDEGTVSFVAQYSAGGQLCEHREQAFFKRIGGEWRFIDGKVDTGEPYRREEPKTGRNDPCPCGSGKKYKKCCGLGK